VLGAAVSIYIQGVNATWTVSQRRVAAGFSRRLQLIDERPEFGRRGPGSRRIDPTATSATLPLYGCAQTTGTCYINSGAGETYPVQGTTPYLYGLLPGYQEGDGQHHGNRYRHGGVHGPTFALDCYTASVTNSTTVTFTLREH